MNITLYEYTCSFCGRRFQVPRKSAKACSRSCAAKIGKGKTGRKPTHSGCVGNKLHPIYKIWSGVKRRCLDKSCISYKYYGGRGITVCEAWLHNFNTFLKWAINAGYSQGLQIDRIDNDKGYSPENCRWVTAKVNCNNRRCSIVWNGLSTQDAATLLGMTRQSIRHRIRILGLPVHLAMTIPKTPNGYLRKTSSIRKWKEDEQ